MQLFLRISRIFGYTLEDLDLEIYFVRLRQPYVIAIENIF